MAKIVLPKPMIIARVKSYDNDDEQELVGKTVRKIMGGYGDSIFYLEELNGETKKELVLCKDCKHRPIKVGNYVEGPRCDDGFRDETCPFLCDDLYYSRIPEDDFYCAYGDNKDGTV